MAASLKMWPCNSGSHNGAMPILAPGSATSAGMDTRASCEVYSSTGESSGARRLRMESLWNRIELSEMDMSRTSQPSGKKKEKKKK